MYIIIPYLLVYILSALAYWNFVRIAYGKKGRWNRINPNILDALIVFMPIINTVFAILGWMESPYENSKRISKFFNVDK